MLPSPNQLRNKIIIKHKASKEPSKQIIRSKSLPFSSYPPPKVDSIEEDEKYFEYSQDAKVGEAKQEGNDPIETFGIC